MRKEILNITFSIIAAVLVLSSCEIQPIDENLIGPDFATVDPASAEGILLNAYAGVPTAIGLTSFVASDDAVHNQLTNNYRRMATGELTAQNNAASQWGKYSMVFYANLFLSVMDDITWLKEEKTNELFARRLKGEAYALRALHHFYILQAHAGKDADGNLLGIPYYKEYIDPDGDFNVPRLSFEATIQAIMDDFDTAYVYLPYIYSNNAADIPDKDSQYDVDAYLTVNSSQYNLRLNGKIVRALQAQVKLFAASPSFLNSNEAYKEAAGYAIPLLDEVSFTLASDGVEFYDKDNDQNNPEFIWRASVAPNSTQEVNNFPPSLNGNGYINPTQNLVDAFPMADGYPVNASPTYAYDAENPYVNRDPRLAKYIVCDNGTINGNIISIRPSESINSVNSISQRSTRTGYYMKKLLRHDVVIPLTGTATVQKHFNVIMRYTELFLILAEAENEIGGPDYMEGASTMSAKDIIRAIRARAMDLASDPYLDAITTKEDMRAMIQNERRLELCFEGQRFWDLRRWGLALDESAYGIIDNGSGYEKIEVEKRMFTGDKYLYMPLPNSEILKYSNLVQNAGW